MRNGDAPSRRGNVFADRHHRVHRLVSFQQYGKGTYDTVGFVSPAYPQAGIKVSQDMILGACNFSDLSGLSIKL